MNVAFAAPDGAGPNPTLLVAHHRGGVDAFTHDVLARLAAIGIAEAAPNFYHRRPTGEDPIESMKSLKDGEPMADINAAVAGDDGPALGRVRPARHSPRIPHL